ncbi:MAG: hypothetical protein L0Z62_45150 [Gemmataceae bacterium]|nr:hypothetical protein [Gemmataceae bacterium]
MTIVALGFLSFLAPSSDLTARNWGFPAWMFTLPIRTRTLVGWRMLNGTGALFAAGLAVVYLVLRPCGIAAPLWLALLAATFLAWIQVLAWTPFVFRLVRLLLMVAILFAIGMVPPLLVLLYEVPTAVILGLQVALIAGAYLLAGHGVVRARRGDGLEARWLSRRVSQLIDRLPRRRRAFASAAGAQLWYEWRRNGTYFPLLVGCLLALCGSLGLWTQQPEDGPNSALFLTGSLLTLPVILASLMASGMGKGDIRTPDPTFPPFLAARPLATTAFVGAKLRMTALSALAACLLGILAALACLPAHGNYEVFKDFWQEGLQHYPDHKAWTLLFLAPLVLFLMTWKNLVQDMWLGLTGRSWVGYVVGLIVIAGLLLSSLVGAGLYYYPQYRVCLVGHALAGGVGSTGQGRGRRLGRARLAPASPPRNAIVGLSGVALVPDGRRAVRPRPVVPSRRPGGAGLARRGLPAFGTLHPVGTGAPGTGVESTSMRTPRRRLTDTGGEFVRDLTSQGLPFPGGLISPELRRC